MTGGLLLILNLCQCLNLILSTDLLSLGNPFTLRKCPLCPAVTLKRFGTFGSIRQQYFASEVGRVLSHTCELVWNAPSESDFRLPGDLPLGSQLSPCHFSAYSAWSFRLTLLRQFRPLLCISRFALTPPPQVRLFLHEKLEPYLCFVIPGLTLRLHFNAYFASRV